MTAAEAQRRLVERRRAEGIPTNAQMRSLTYDAVAAVWCRLPDDVKADIADGVGMSAEIKDLDPDRTAAAFKAAME